MIAQVNAAESFRDVLDYLMNPKNGSLDAENIKNDLHENNFFEKSGKSEYFEKAASYNSGERHRILGGNLGGQTIAELNIEFKSVSGLRPEARKKVFHLSISANKKDVISVNLWREIGTEIIEKLGFKESPFVIIQHRDREHDHIHIIASRVSVRGNIINNWQSKRRTEVIIRDLETKHNLEKTISSKDTIRSAPKRNETELFDKTGEKSIKMKMQDKVEEAFQESRTVSNFIQNLEIKNVSAVPIFESEKIKKSSKIQKESTEDKVIGICFWHENEMMKGSNLGNGFSWKGLQSRGLDYEPNRDNKLLRKVKKESEVKIEAAKNDGRKDANKQIQILTFKASPSAKAVEKGEILLAELAIREAEYRLSNHIKTKEIQKFQITGNESGKQINKQISLEDLSRERRAYASRSVESLTKSGMLEMIAEGDNISEEKAAKRIFAKASAYCETGQSDLINNIETVYKDKHDKLLQNLETAKNE